MKVEPVNKYPKPADGFAKPPSSKKSKSKKESVESGLAALPTQQLALFTVELALAKEQVKNLEAQLEAERDARRADAERLSKEHAADIERIQERLLREMTELRVKIAVLEKGQGN